MELEGTQKGTDQKDLGNGDYLSLERVVQLSIQERCRPFFLGVAMTGKIDPILTMQKAMEATGLPRHALEKATREGHLKRFFPYDRERGSRWYFLTSEIIRWQIQRSDDGGGRS